MPIPWFLPCKTLEGEPGLARLLTWWKLWDNEISILTNDIYGNFSGRNGKLKQFWKQGHNGVQVPTWKVLSGGKCRYWLKVSQSCQVIPSPGQPHHFCYLLALWTWNLCPSVSRSNYPFSVSKLAIWKMIAGPSFLSTYERGQSISRVCEIRLYSPLFHSHIPSHCLFQMPEMTKYIYFQFSERSFASIKTQFPLCNFALCVHKEPKFGDQWLEWVVMLGL